MKIVITPETDKEKADPTCERVEIINVFEYALVGRFTTQINEGSFQRLCINDKYILLGRLEETRQRLKDYNGVVN